MVVYFKIIKCESDCGCFFNNAKARACILWKLQWDFVDTFWGHTARSPQEASVRGASTQHPAPGLRWLVILAEKEYLFRDSPRPRRGCRLLRPDLASGLCQELCTKGWRVNTGAGGSWTRQRKTNIASINNRFNFKLSTEPHIEQTS